jgi:hypothetical protein
MREIYIDKTISLHTSNGEVYIELEDGTTLIFEGSELYRDLIHILPMAKQAHEWNNERLEERWKEFNKKQLKAKK